MDYEKLEQNIGYTFNDKGLLINALTHTSYANEKFKGHGHLKSNERLEFVGDAVVDLIVGEYLYLNNRDWPEGELSRRRSEIVCTNALALMGEELGIPDYLRLGVGEEQDGGKHKPSLIENAVESIVAAIYLDSSFEKVKEVMLPHFEKMMASVDFNGITLDYKSQLQEILAKQHVIPEYRIIDSTGPAHCPVFKAEVVATLDSIQYVGIGNGRKKRDAEQMAAKDLLEKIK